MSKASKREEDEVSKVLCKMSTAFGNADEDDDEDFFKEFDVEDLDLEAPVKPKAPLTTHIPGKSKGPRSWNPSQSMGIPL